MFSWFRWKSRTAEKREDAAPRAVGPPTDDLKRGGTKLSVNFTRGEKAWTESCDIVKTLADLLPARGHAVRPHDDGVLHVESGILLQPSLVDFGLLEDGRPRTTTIIDARHRAFGKTPLFEFQHSAGDTIEQAVSIGFDHWAQIDLPVLIDAVLDKPKNSTLFVIGFPEKNGAPARTRGVLLGPVGHIEAEPRDVAPTEGDDHGAFCPCCMFTRSMIAFEPLLQSDRVIGLRLYAARGADGTPTADCRANREDFEPGKQALIEYVKTWPSNGFAFRKQYVIIRTQAAEDVS